MKKTTLILAMFLLTFSFTQAQEYAGAKLVSSVQLGFDVDDPLFDLAEHNDTIFITCWVSSKLVKFSTISKEMVPDYPISLPDAAGIHGCYVDANGIIWAFDLDGSQIIKYSSDNTFIESIPLGSQPGSGIEIDGKLYVVDRGDNKIYILNMETLVIESSFAIDIMGDGGNKSDIFYYNDTLYMVSDEFNGVLKMNIDGTQQQLINTNKSYQGLFIQADTLFLAGGAIDIINMDGDILNQIDVENDGITTGAVDLHVKNDTIYVIGYSDNVMLIYDLPSNKNEMLTYTVPLSTETKFIDAGDYGIRIEVSVPEGSNISALKPTFTLSEGAVAYNTQTMEEEISGVNLHDFSFMPVSYMVKAEDGSQQLYSTFVYEEGVDYKKEIISFNIQSELANEINQEEKTINITVPQGTDLTSLVADFELSYAAILVRIKNPETYEMEIQISGETENDFSEPLTVSVFNHLMNDFENYEITVELSTSSNLLADEKNIFVFPNPTNGKLNIDFTDNNIKKIVIADITGKQIFEVNKVQKNNAFDLSACENGIYFISVQTNKETFSIKIIKE